MTLALIPSCLRAQAAPDDHREAPEVRNLTLRGVTHVDPTDLQKSLSTQATTCKNVLLEPFCLISHSPTFVDRHYLDETEFARDVLRIRAYYWTRGYRDTQVDTTVARVGKHLVDVTFDVHENAPTRVRRLVLQYDSTLISNKQRDHSTLLHAGDPLDLTQLDTMVVNFQTILWNQGYGDATVDTTTVVDTAAKLGDVTVRMVPNRLTTVGTITITGNQKVATRTILNLIKLRPRTLYKYQDVLESQRNLYVSNLFRQATVYVPFQRDSVKNVEISVTEAPLHMAHVGVGANNIDFLQLETQYTAFNLFGGARRLDIAANAGNLLAQQLSGRAGFQNVTNGGPFQRSNIFLAPTWNASVTLAQPAFLQRPENQVGVSFFTHRQMAPSVFVDRGYGGQLTFTRQIALRAPASLTYRYELNRVDASDVYFCVNYGVCDTTSIGALRSHATLSPLTLSAFVDRSDQPFEPTKGYVARIDAEHASSATLSDYRYNRVSFDAAAYTHRSGSKQVFSAHLRLGFVRALANSRTDIAALHPTKRFYAGGAQSVRGFGENMLGPRILTIAPDQLDSAHAVTTTGAPCDTHSLAIQACDPNTGTLTDASFNPQPLGGTSLLEGSVEYRFPLPMFRPHLEGAVFVDGGIVGQTPVHNVADLTSLTHGMGAVTPGFGIRYVSPVGPIRFDIGINPQRAEVLTVVTSVVENGQQKIIPLSTQRRYLPTGGGLLNRMVLHFSIGEAY
jgi:outer membrane protein assembly complex protein YaeT